MEGLEDYAVTCSIHGELNPDELTSQSYLADKLQTSCAHCLSAYYMKVLPKLKIYAVDTSCKEKGIHYNIRCEDHGNLALYPTQAEGSPTISLAQSMYHTKTMTSFVCMQCMLEYMRGNIEPLKEFDKEHFLCEKHGKIRRLEEGGRLEGVHVRIMKFPYTGKCEDSACSQCYDDFIKSKIGKLSYKLKRK